MKSVKKYTLVKTPKANALLNQIFIHQATDDVLLKWRGECGSG